MVTPITCTVHFIEYLRNLLSFVVIHQICAEEIMFCLAVYTNEGGTVPLKIEIDSKLLNWLLQLIR